MLTITGLSPEKAAAYPLKRCDNCGSENNTLDFNGDSVGWHCGECGKLHKFAGTSDLLSIINYLIYRR